MKAPGTLIEWVRHYTQMDWTDIAELFEIEIELLEHFGPTNLERIIKAAQSLKDDYDDTERYHKEQWDFYYNK